jgi:hypothetical protein
VGAGCGAGHRGRAARTDGGPSGLVAQRVPEASPSGLVAQREQAQRAGAARLVWAERRRRHASRREPVWQRAVVARMRWMRAAPSKQWRAGRMERADAGAREACATACAGASSAGRWRAHGGVRELLERDVEARAGASGTQRAGVQALGGRRTGGVSSTGMRVRARE